MGLRSHPRGRGPRTSAAARRPHGSRSCPAPRCASVPATLWVSEPPSRPLEGAAAVRGMNALRRELLHEDRRPARDGGRRDARRAHAPDRRPAVADGLEVLVQAGAGDASSNLDEAYREAGATDRPRRGVALQPGGHGPARRPALGRGGRDAAEPGRSSSAPWAPWRSRSWRRSWRNAGSPPSAWTPSRASPAPSRWTRSPARRRSAATRRS